MATDAASGGGTAGSTVCDALSAATDALRAGGSESPRLDAELLLAEATGLGRTALVVEAARGLSGAEARAFGTMVRRRVAHEPVAYILGRKGFRRIELKVDGRALIPRPETELLVELALRERPGSVLDVGTGSGAIALAVADELPDATVVAVDTSVAALSLARENAAALGLTDRVRFELGTFPQDPPPGGFDLLLANLPYVPEGDRSTLAPDIVRYEPEAALFAGEDGLDAIRSLIELAGGPAARPGLRCAAIGLEIGVGQAAATERLLVAAGFTSTEAVPDLAGIPRVVIGRAGTLGDGP